MKKSLSNLQETAGLFGGLIQQARLVWRLWHDRRVPGWVKLIPVAGLVYLLSPLDFIPDVMLPGVAQLDDLAVILLSVKIFVDLVPPGVVREHLLDLMGQPGQARSGDKADPGAYIDAPYRLLDPDEE